MLQDIANRLRMVVAQSRVTEGRLSLLIQQLKEDEEDDGLPEERRQP